MHLQKSNPATSWNAGISRLSTASNALIMVVVNVIVKMIVPTGFSFLPQAVRRKTDMSIWGCWIIYRIFYT